MDSRGIHALNEPMARITRPFLPTDHLTLPAERLERTLFLLELLVWLLLLDVGVLLYEFVVDPQPITFATIGAVGLSFVVSALFVRAGVSVRHVALGLASFFYLTCTVGATLDGPSLELPLWLTIIPPIAAYLIHPRAGLLFCLAAIACGAASIEVYALLTGSTHQIVDFQSLGPRMAPAFVALGCTLMFIEQLHRRTRRRLAWVISLRDEAERAVLDFAAKMALTSYKVTDEDPARLREVGLDDAATVEVINVVSIQSAIERAANILAVAPDAGPLLATASGKG